MNAKQRAQARRNARRGLTPSAAPAQPLVLLALLAEHEALKAKVRAYIEEQQTSLDDLRLQTQYVIFDNECLRREVAEWQRICHEKNLEIARLRGEEIE